MARTAAVKKEQKALDALALLHQDHEEVSAAFEKYEKGKERMNDTQNRAFFIRPLLSKTNSTLN